MSRLLLLLCCATVLVSGIHGSSPSVDPGHPPVANAPVEPKAPEQHAEVAVLPSKSAEPAHAVPQSVDKTVNNDTKAHEAVSSPPEGDDNPPKPSPPTTTSEKPPTTAAPTTTVKPVPPTTQAPTTPAPSTTSAPTTIPTPTSTAPPVPPTPVPAPSAGKWVVNETDKICIIAQMAVQFNVSYMNANKTKLFKIFNLPSDNATTVATGSCGKLEQNLTLQWPSVKANDSMILHFLKNETTKHYTLHHLEVILSATDFPAANITGNITLVHETAFFSTELSNSYRCFKQQRLSLKLNNSNETAGYLTVSELQFQAFKPDNATVFGLAKDCAFDTPDIVPIAVGCALAGLVVIVLVTYLVGRRRSQARGYLSM